MKMSRPIGPILTLKLVAMATSVEPSEKRVQNGQSTIKYLPYGENLVKICPVDFVFSLLKCLLTKNNASRT